MPQEEQSPIHVESTRQSVWKRIGRWSPLKEMIGRVDEDDTLLSDRSVYWNNLFDSTTQDNSRPDYDLNMAIYKASVVKGSDGKKKGADYIFGATFAKPIVNAPAAFAFSGLRPPQISGEGDFYDKVNNFLYAERKTLFDSMRFGSRDGDAFVRLVPTADTAYLEVVSPDMVDVVTNPENINEVIGYDITHILYEDPKSKTKKTVIIEQYRNEAPFYKRTKFANNNKNGEVQEENNDYKFLLMAHYANEKDPNAKYGTSDYQNVYVLMKAYHAMMENALKGAIYNSQPTPIIKGIKNLQKFAQSNFESTGKTKDGQPKYKIEWRPDKLMLLGEGMDMAMLTIPDHVGPATKVLEYLFYCIVQASETPEFVMGTAVASSKASVSEQLPVMVNKAYRKRGDFENFLYDIIDMYAQYLLAVSEIKQAEIPTDGYGIEWYPIEDEDKNLNLEIVKVLKDLGLITDETALSLTGIQIDDVEDELVRAREQQNQRVAAEMRHSDIYSPFSAYNDDNKEVQEAIDDDKDYKSTRTVKKKKTKKK